MVKSIVVLVLAAFVANTYARSTAISLFQLPDDDDSFDNEIHRDVPIMTEEKRLALETNKVKPEISIPQTDSASQEDDYQNDMEQPNLQSSGFINQTKAPTSTFEYILEFLYGVCQWVYNKFIA